MEEEADKSETDPDSSSGETAAPSEESVEAAPAGETAAPSEESVEAAPAGETAAPSEESVEAAPVGAANYHESEESPYGDQPDDESDGDGDDSGPGRLLWILLVVLAAAIAFWLIVHWRNDNPTPTAPNSQNEPLSLKLVLDPDGSKGDAPELTYTLDCSSSEAVDQQDACVIAQSLPEEAFTVETQPPEQACTEIYGGPQVLQITGERDGKAFALTRTRVNGCEISAFDIWNPLLQVAFPSYQPQTTAPQPQTTPTPPQTTAPQPQTAPAPEVSPSQPQTTTPAG